jgi:outer membrane protein assembly factor BamB
MVEYWNGYFPSFDGWADLGAFFRVRVADFFLAALPGWGGPLVLLVPLGFVGLWGSGRRAYSAALAVFYGGVLYAYSSDGDIVAVQTATGEVLWRKSARNDFAGLPGKWAYAESPLIDGNTLVVAPGGSEATIVALNKKDGSVIWKSAIPGGESAAYSSAIVTQAAGRKQYVHFLDKGVVGVDARTGDFLWRYDKTASGPANIPSPVAHDGLVYSSNARRFGGGLVALKADGNGVSAEEVYFERSVPNTLGGQVLLDGYLYGTNSEGLVAAEFATGKIAWQAGDGGPGSVLYADGQFYVHNENGDVALVDASPQGHQVKGKFTPPGPPPHLQGDRLTWQAKRPAKRFPRLLPMYIVLHPLLLRNFSTGLHNRGSRFVRALLHRLSAPVDSCPVLP